MNRHRRVHVPRDYGHLTHLREVMQSEEGRSKHCPQHRAPRSLNVQPVVDYVRSFGGGDDEITRLGVDSVSWRGARSRGRQGKGLFRLRESVSGSLVRWNSGIPARSGVTSWSRGSRTGERDRRQGRLHRCRLCDVPYAGSRRSDRYGGPEPRLRQLVFVSDPQLVDSGRAFAPVRFRSTKPRSLSQIWRSSERSSERKRTRILAILATRAATRLASRQSTAEVTTTMGCTKKL